MKEKKKKRIRMNKENCEKIRKKCERNKEQRCREEPGQVDFSCSSAGSNAATCTSYQRSISGEAQYTQHQDIVCEHNIVYFLILFFKLLNTCVQVNFILIS